LSQWGAFGLNRETTNRIRFVIEEILPPVLRDSRIFKFAAERVFGDYISRAAEFRRRAPFLTELEYEDLYRNTPQVHDGTDNSLACLRQISQDVVGDAVCDIGCGTGQLLQYIDKTMQNPPSTLVGCDFIVPDHAVGRVRFVKSKIEALPFSDGEFDTVTCTHVIEHILDYRAAISELRRIASRRLIIVVPQEREGRYTFNPHFNFFAYPESFLRAMIPVPKNYECRLIGRDIYYREDIT
jgi:SAM-dependent methyltransferase